MFTYHAYVCQTTYKRLKNRFRSKGFWPKYWVGFMTVRRNQFIRLATNLKLCGRYVHVFRFNVHAQNYEKHSTYSPFEIWFSGWAFRPKVNFNHWSKLHLNLFFTQIFQGAEKFWKQFQEKPEIQIFNRVKNTVSFSSRLKSCMEKKVRFFVQRSLGYHGGFHLHPSTFIYISI